MHIKNILSNKKALILFRSFYGIHDRSSVFSNHGTAPTILTIICVSCFPTFAISWFRILAVSAIVDHGYEKNLFLIFHDFNKIVL
jgi:hypothetical protein